MTLQQWYQTWNTCRACALGGRSYRHVPISPWPAAVHARYLFLGEAPGKSEDTLGEAFIGASGRLLRQAITDAGIALPKCAFTNLLACRPCDDRGGPNRPPKDLEIARCAPRLQQLFQLVHPSVVILVGRYALDYAPPVIRPAFAGTVVSVVHPAYLLRQGGRSAEGYARMVNILYQMRVKDTIRRGYVRRDQEAD